MDGMEKPKSPNRSKLQSALHTATLVGLTTMGVAAPNDGGRTSEALTSAQSPIAAELQSQEHQRRLDQISKSLGNIDIDARAATELLARGEVTDKGRELFPLLNNMALEIDSIDRTISGIGSRTTAGAIRITKVRALIAQCADDLDSLLDTMSVSIDDAAFSERSESKLQGDWVTHAATARRQLDQIKQTMSQVRDALRLHTAAQAAH